MLMIMIMIMIVIVKLFDLRKSFNNIVLQSIEMNQEPIN